MHDGINGRECSPNNIQTDFEYTGKSRGVPAIKKAFSLVRLPGNKIYVVRGVKQREVIDGRSLWLPILDTIAQARGSKFGLKNIMSIRTEWMSLAESIAA